MFQIHHGSNHSHTMRARKHFAFSLLELLVVISITIALAGILLPAIGRARRGARDTGCLSNLRQWGKATQLYAAENNDRLPRDGSPNGISKDEGWYIDLPRTIGIPTYAEMSWRTNADIAAEGSIWICPANPRRSNGNNLFHYCLNEHVNGRGGGRRADLTSIQKPAATVWMFDNGKLAAVAQQNNPHTNLHRAGAHFLFLDGHVQHFASTRYWDFENNKGLIDNPELRWKP